MLKTEFFYLINNTMSNSQNIDDVNIDLKRYNEAFICYLNKSYSLKLYTLPDKTVLVCLNNMNYMIGSMIRHNLINGELCQIHYNKYEKFATFVVHDTDIINRIIIDRFVNACNIGDTPLVKKFIDSGIINNQMINHAFVNALNKSDHLLIELFINSTYIYPKNMANYLSKFHKQFII